MLVGLKPNKRVSLCYNTTQYDVRRLPAASTNSTDDELRRPIASRPGAQFEQTRHRDTAGHGVARTILAKKFSGHDGTVPGSVPAKFEVRICSHFGAISI